MEIRRLTDNMRIISELSDEPSDIDGLTADELKAKFDAAGNIIKEYMNNSLIPDVETGIVKAVSDVVVQSGNMPAGGTSGQALVKASGAPFDWDFRTIHDFPPGGGAGFVLAKRTGADYDARFEPHIAHSWELLREYAQAGTYAWTAPDFYGDGQPYSVGVYIIGGGGGGGAMALTTAETSLVTATGGASGYAKCTVVEVEPGREYTVVVGAGGALAEVIGGNKLPVRQEGNAGGASAFAGVTAPGGGGGWGAGAASYSGNLASTAAPGADGGQGSDAPDSQYNAVSRSMRPIAPAKGLAVYNSVDGTALVGGRSDPASPYNRFDGEYYLAAGGQAMAFATASIFNSYSQKGYTFDDGGKSGDGAAMCASNASGAATAQSASAPGCGGGAAAAKSTTSTVRAISGAGAAGAVYIYVRELKR